MPQNLQEYAFGKEFPEEKFLSLLRKGDARISDAEMYLGMLQDFLSGALISDSRYSSVVDHLDEVESILNRMNPPKVVPFDAERAFQPKVPSSRVDRFKSRDKSLADLQAEIIAAATNVKPKIALAQVAISNGYSPDLIQAFADELLDDQGMGELYDLNKREYEKCIGEIRDLELKIADPGERAWKMQALAKKYKRSKDELRESYCKSLIAHHLAELKNLKQVKSEHGYSREWLLRGFIPKASLVLLHAQGGIGKTLFAHHLIKLISSGTDWEEYTASRERRQILYIQTDTSPLSMVEALKQADIGDDLPILYHTTWSTDHTAQMYNWVRQHRPALVVIDSLTSVNRFSTVSENDTEYAQPVLYLRDIASEFKTSFLIIHHSNSEGQVRGNKAVRNAVDEVWRLEPIDPRDPSNPERILIQEKSRSRMPMRYKLKFDDDTFGWENLGIDLPEEAEGEQNKSNPSGRKLIVNHLQSHIGIGFAPLKLAYLLGIPEPTCKRELPALYREGLIERKRNENYAVGKTGEGKHLYFVDT